MSCKHCLWQVPLETKPGFKYRTSIVGNLLIVSKNTIFGRKKLYCNTIKKCPVCGDELLDMGNFAFSSNCIYDLKNMLIKRFGEDKINEKIKNYQEID